MWRGYLRRFPLQGKGQQLLLAALKSSFPELRFSVPRVQSALVQHLGQCQDTVQKCRDKSECFMISRKIEKQKAPVGCQKTCWFCVKTYMPKLTSKVRELETKFKVLRLRHDIQKWYLKDHRTKQTRILIRTHTQEKCTRTRS